MDCDASCKRAKEKSTRNDDRTGWKARMGMVKVNLSRYLLSRSRQGSGTFVID